MNLTSLPLNAVHSKATPALRPAQLFASCLNQTVPAPSIRFSANNDEPWAFLRGLVDKAVEVGKAIIDDPKAALQNYGENNLVYQPTINGAIPQKTSLNQVGDPALKAKIEEVNFTAADGVKLHGWYIPPKNGDYTVVFSHGNGGNIAYRQPIWQLLSDAGYGVLAYDYRGYGNSEGTPTEEGLYKDVAAASKFLEDVKATPKKDQIMMGESIGGAMAIDAASKDRYRMLVTVSTFTSLPEVAGSMFQNVPVVADISKNVLPSLIQQQYPSLQKLSTVVSPALVVHGDKDELVPYEMSNRLYEKLESVLGNSDVVDVLTAVNCGHNNVFQTIGPELITFMRTLESKTRLQFPKDPVI